MPPYDDRIHHAQVVTSDSATGKVTVKLPGKFGNSETVDVSFTGREKHDANLKWLVPDAGDSIIVCQEDSDCTDGVFWVNTTVPPDPPYTFDDNLSTTFGNVLHIDVTTPSWGGTGGKIGLNTTSPTFPVQMAGAAEQFGNTLYIEETSFVGSSVAAFYLGQWIRVGAGDSGNAKGNFYVQDKDANKDILYHTGHSNTTNGGLTITATGTHTTPSGTFTRYLKIEPTYDASGYEYVRFISDCDTARSMYFNRHVQLGGSIYPAADGTRYLGYSGNRWNTIYATNGTINTSDQNEKTDIADSDLGLNFINALRPVSFKWIDRGGGVAGVRTHYGLLGQEVESVLGAAAATTAIWTKSAVPARDAVEETYNDNGTIEMEGRGAVEAHDLQGLRYDELISPMIKAIQELTTRLTALESA